MNVIRLFFKRLYWHYMLQRSTKTELVNMLKTPPDMDVADLLWRHYIRQVRDIRELMGIVYDDRHEFHKDTRLIAGGIVLRVLKQTWGWFFLPDVTWTDTENGRLAYLIGVGMYLPDLQCRASSIVEHYFYPHERQAFTGAW